MSFKRNCLALLSAGVFLAAFQGALGQADFPTLQGAGQRTGHNSDPVNYNSGRTILQWFTGPNPLDTDGTITVDDSNGGVNGLGVATGSAAAVSGSWSTINNAANEAADVYQPNGNVAAYHFASCTPSIDAADPATPSNPASFASFGFTVAPANLGFSENYAVYAWLPIGPTLVGATQTPFYPQRYFVYQVHFGANQVYTDVVDTYAAGFGWVRLGNGGHATNAVFNCDGTHAITVNLLNTIPVNSDGSLTTGTTTTAANYLVYADAVQIIPSSGYFSATPTSAYLRDGTGAPIVDAASSDVDVSPAGQYRARITSVLNVSEMSLVNNVLTATPNALVRSYEMNPHRWRTSPTAPGAANGIPDFLWSWSPSPTAGNAVSVSVGNPQTGGWTSDTTNTYQGANYYIAKLVGPTSYNSTTAGTAVGAAWQPTATTGPGASTFYTTPVLGTVTGYVGFPATTAPAGNYSIYTYLPGGSTYGTAVQYQILQNGVVVYTGTVNEQAGGGWVALGSGTFAHDPATNPLDVRLTNAASTTDQNAGALAFADAVMYVGASPTKIINYAATLNAGSYSIYTYLPGNIATESYGTAVTYEILQGGNIVGTGTLNEAAGGGWVQLGTSTWVNDPVNAPLTVNLTNLGSASDATNNYLVYASGVKFVPTNASFAVNSSPVHAQVTIKKNDGTSALTQVVLVADENGRIHCLDEVGNTDGTTTEYWSYPSTPDTTNSAWVDPNLAAGIDGPSTSTVPSAIMPSQFSLSTAVVKTGVGATPTDRLYITSVNGRVYCIDMAGRGDYTATHPGSTQRLWSYPNDYPETQLSSTLGQIRGSVVYGDATDGLAAPTIFVPAATGRIIALDAVGDTTTRTTTVDWAYPSLAATATLPPIEMTPTLAFPATPSLYFGTLTNQNSGAAGTVYSLNANTGAVQWSFNGATNGATTGTNVVSETVSDFVAGPTTATAAVLAEPAAPYTVTPQDSVYFLNNNNQLYGFNAHTGGLLTTSGTNLAFSYDTNVVGGISSQNLGLNFITTYDRNQAGLRSMPVVMVPTSGGQLLGFFANVDDYNLFSATGFPVNLEAYGTNLTGTNVTSTAFSNSRMISADDLGYMYIWDNDSQNYGLENPGAPPASTLITPNVPSPEADAFRHPIIKLITQAGAAAVNAVNNLNQTGVTYPQIDPGIYNAPNPPTGQSAAFELGQTAYICIYHFPYQPNNATANNGEVVNVRLSQNNKVIRQVTGQVHQLAATPAPPTVGGSDPVASTWSYDGVAVVSFTFADGGANSIPAGQGVITADITTSALNNTSQEIVSDPTTGASLPFQTANPLGITVVDPNSGAHHDFAFDTNTYDSEPLTNGTPFVAGDPEGQTNTNQLLQSLGFSLDGQSETKTMYLYDRSLMTLLRGPGQGLANVRMDRGDLAWQGGSGTVYNALSQTLYPGFEDLPTNVPNNSLDYPNLGRDRIGFSLTPTGGTYNPLLTGAILAPPLNASGNALTITDDPTRRILVPTPLLVTANVPKYQPGVNMKGLLAGAGTTDNPDDLLHVRHDSTGAVLPQGYFGVSHVFIDNGTSSIPGQFSDQDSYRQFYLSTSVMPDWDIEVTTPTVDLGPLAGGTGYDPLSPYNSSAGTYSPINGLTSPAGTWSGAYQTFGVENNGNINLLNLHFAKATEVSTGGQLLPWGFFSSSNDGNAWLDATLDLWSNIDPVFAIHNPNDTSSSTTNVFLQKSRVTAGVPSALSINPVPLPNANVPISLTLSANKTGLNPNFPSQQTPKVGVSVPFGFPVGTYSSPLRVIDDAILSPLYPNTSTTALNGLTEVWENLLGENSVEPNSDPTLTLSFTSRETRVTNSSTQYTATMADDFIDQYAANHSGAQPQYAPTYSSPTALRDSFGNLIAAWSSNQASFSATTNSTDPLTDAGRKLYVWSVDNRSAYGSTSVTAGVNDPITKVNPQSPLRDLDFFNPTGNQWFSLKTSATGYPSSSILPNDNNGTLIAGTESYDSPSFPVSGSTDPTTGTDLGYEYMAFVGSGQKQSGSGRVAVSHVFLSHVKSGANGSVAMDSASGSPWNTSFTSAGTQIDDPTTVKGKPTVIGTSTGAFVFYPVTAGSSEALHFSRFDPAAGSFGKSVSLNFGLGFESVTDPKAMVRPYSGLVAGFTPNLVDLTFSGKLRGRANSDIYLSQMRMIQVGGEWQIVDINGNSIETSGAGTPFAFFAQQTNELLTAEGNGTYRAKGVEWDRTKPISVVQYLNGIPSSILINGTGNSDRETGMISYDTSLGGKVYIDPELGTVKFSHAVPNQVAEIRLTYTPGFLRVTAGGSAAYSDPTTIFENNYSSENTEWFSQTGVPMTAGATPKDARMVFMYDKAAGSNGQTARPYISTMRFGIRLPSRIAVGSGGIPVSLSVSGNQGPYQLDPANGRVYFTSLDEDNTVTVTYQGVDESTGGLQTAQAISAPVSFVLEKAESPVLIDQAVNEGNLTAFLDPFNYQSRPALIWMFYTSTRAGVPDVYFQTIAPRFAPAFK